LWAGIGVGLLASPGALAGADIGIDSPSVAEGNSGTTTLPFTIGRTRDTGSQIILQYQSEDGTATAPPDYVSLPSTSLTIPAGATSASVNVTVNGDTDVEDDEYFFLHLTAALAVGPAAGFGTKTSFKVGGIFPNGHRPYAVAVGDINGDGKLDLLVANSNSNDVGILLNTTASGAQTPSFATPATFGVGLNPFFLALGDVNGDGKPDLVVANAGSNSVLNGSVSVLLNGTATGAATPSFSSATNFLDRTGCGPEVVDFGDINGDGRLDIAVACSANGTAVVLLNDTEPGAAIPSFNIAGNIAFGYTFSGLGLADLNGDRRPDLVLTNVGGRVFVLLNETASGAATTSFSATQTFNLGDIPTDVSIGDVNGDGKPDLAVSLAKNQSPDNPNPGDGRVAVLLNTTAPGATTASFTAPGEFFAYSDVDAVALRDVNGDGRPDLVVSTGSPGVVCQAFLNTTPPGAATPRFDDAGGVYVGGSVISVVTGDLNGDGKPDVVMANNDPTYDNVSVLLNTTVLSPDTPDFAAANSFATGANPVAIALSDLNGDGVVDLAVANSGDDSLSVLFDTTVPGSASTGFEAAGSFTTGEGPSGVAVSDFNGDGRPDLAVANEAGNTISVFLNGTILEATVADFADAASFGVGTAPRAAAAGDLNGDGKPDLAVANGGSGNVTVLFNTTMPGSGSAGFAAAGEFAVGGEPAAIALGDLNGDGRSDLATANRTDNTLSVLLNATAPGAESASFTTVANFAVGSGPISVARGDINGDGRPDLVVASTDSNNVSVLLNTTAPGATAPSFGAATNFAAGSGPTAVALHDVNGDGRSDLVVANGSGNDITVLLNATAPGAGTTSFTLLGNFAGGANPRAIVVGDLNGDGQNDLIVANGGDSSVSTLLNRMFTVNLVNDTGIGTIVDDDSDRVPDAFSFTDQADVAISTVATSDAITVSGINVAVAISVSGGKYSVDGGSFTAAAGTVSNGQAVRVRHTSAATFSTVTDTILTIGGVSDTFTSTTVAADTTPDAFAFADQASVPVSTVITSSAITVSGINTSTGISVSGGEYSVDGGIFTAAAGTATNGQTMRVRHTSAPTENTATNTTLTIGGVSDTFTSITASSGSEPDTTPDPFSFIDQQNVALGTVVVSNSITVSGIDAASLVSVAGGEYSVDGGGFTAASGSVVNGQSVRVRHTSAATFSTATNTTLTIGGVSDTFTSTTLAADTTPDAFTFTDQSGVPVDMVITSNAITVSGINTSAGISVNGGQYSVDGGGFTTTAASVTSGQSVRVRHVSAATFNTATNTTLTIGGVSDTFTSTTAAVDTTPDAFTFTDQPGVPIGMVINSDAITVSGINTSAGISVNGGQYSVDGGGFTTTAGSVTSGQSVRVRHTSAATANTATSTTLSIGGVSDTFTSTTEAADTTPDAFTFTDQSGVTASTLVTSNAVIISGINTAAGVNVTNGEYSLDDGSFTSAAGTVTNGQSVRVRHTSASSPNTATSTTLSIGGVSDTFTSITANAQTSPPPDGGGGGALSVAQCLAGLLLALSRRRRRAAAAGV
jgi:hypothetical protein